MPKIDVPVTTSDNERGKRWVEVPQKDLFDFPHPPIGINMKMYHPGRHFVDAVTADWIEERLRLKYLADLKIMRPGKDVTSENIMNRFGIGARAGGGRAVENPESMG